MRTAIATVCLSGTLPEKLEAIRCYASQFDGATQMVARFSPVPIVECGDEAQRGFRFAERGV